MAPARVPQPQQQQALAPSPPGTLQAGNGAAASSPPMSMAPVALGIAISFVLNMGAWAY